MERLRTLWRRWLALLAALAGAVAVFAADPPQTVEAEPEKGAVSLASGVATAICTATNAVPLSITITITNSVDALVWPGTNTTVSGGYFIKGNGGTVTISFPLADQRAWRGAGLGGTALGTYIREYR